MHGSFLLCLVSCLFFFALSISTTHMGVGCVFTRLQSSMFAPFLFRLLSCLSTAHSVLFSLSLRTQPPRRVCRMTQPIVLPRPRSMYQLVATLRGFRIYKLGCVSRDERVVFCMRVVWCVQATGCLYVVRSLGQFSLLEKHGIEQRKFKEKRCCFAFWSSPKHK